MTGQIRAIIWDMGGVLLRTENRTPRNKLAEKFGIEAFELENAVFESETAKIATIGEITAFEHWAAVAKRFQLGESELKSFQEEFWAGDKMDYELLQFIQNKRPEVKTALLSNAWSDARQEIGEPTGLLNYFDVSIFSAEVHLAKPDPRIYSLVLDQLNVLPQEAVFVDDMERNTHAASQLGIHGIRFVSAQQVIEEIQELF